MRVLLIAFTFLLMACDNGVGGGLNLEIGEGVNYYSSNTQGVEFQGEFLYLVFNEPVIVEAIDLDSTVVKYATTQGQHDKHNGLCVVEVAVNSEAMIIKVFKRSGGLMANDGFSGVLPDGEAMLFDSGDWLFVDLDSIRLEQLK